MNERVAVAMCSNTLGGGKAAGERKKPGNLYCMQGLSVEYIECLEVTAIGAVNISVWACGVILRPHSLWKVAMLSYILLLLFIGECETLCRLLS